MIIIHRLREVLRPLGKSRVDFVNDVRELYKIMRQQQYEDQGKRLPVGELLSLDEEKSLAKYLHEAASCLKDPLRGNIHVFNINSSKSLKETIYHAFIQGKTISCTDFPKNPILWAVNIKRFFFLARDNLSRTKKKYRKTIDEELQMALRWSIGGIIENQSVTIAKIWNDTNKV
jgi:hypothetical protein